VLTSKIYTKNFNSTGNYADDTSYNSAFACFTPLANNCMYTIDDVVGYAIKKQEM